MAAAVTAASKKNIHMVREEDENANEEVKYFFFSSLFL
jgi:hypothetical protein